MQDFFNMGGYGGYVWPAYGASLFVLTALAAAVWRRGRSLDARLKREQSRAADGGPKDAA